MKEFDDLVTLMDRLRGEGGCPWDREQTPRDLRGYLLEEAYEVVESIDVGDPDHLRDELGDLLFQIVFLARIGKEQGWFTIEDVALAVSEKMTRRHPHVFGDATASTSEEVLKQWEDIKRREKTDAGREEQRVSVLDGIPRSLPALVRAERLGEKASRVGFDWSEPSQVLDKVDEELEELRAALRAEGPDRVAEEFGDLLFALSNLARHLGIHAEGSLQGANERFAMRFRKIETELAARGTDPSRVGLEELENLWRKAKES